MSWIAAGLGAGVVTSYLNQKQQAENDKKAMLANAAQIRYSPWTGAKVQTQGPNHNSQLSAIASGAMQGGLAGAAFGQQFGKATPTAGATQNPWVVSDSPQTLYDPSDPMAKSRGMIG